MQPNDFSEFKTGDLEPIRIQDRYDDFTFIPHPLPPRNWDLDRSLWPLVADARDRVSELNGVARTLPNPTLLIRPLQRREAITSNRIEGTDVSPTELLLSETCDTKSADWHDVVAYDDALREGTRRLAEGRTIDGTLICELHARLLATSRGRDKHPGQFRTIPVFVGGRRFIPPPADRIADLVANLESYFESTHADPLVRAFLGHVQFETIHPFEDGNGRIGRLMLSLCLARWLRHAQPWLYLSEFLDRHRDEYILRMTAVRTNGEWDQWIRFGLHGAIEQADTSIVRCRKLADLRARYDASVGQDNKRMPAILDRLFTNPFLEISRWKADRGMTYHTAKADVAKLLAAGVVSEVENRSPTTFIANEIFKTAYGD